MKSYLVALVVSSVLVLTSSLNTILLRGFSTTSLTEDENLNLHRVQLTKNEGLGLGRLSASTQESTESTHSTPVPPRANSAVSIGFGRFPEASEDEADSLQVPLSIVSIDAPSSRSNNRARERIPLIHHDHRHFKSNALTG